MPERERGTIRVLGIDLSTNPAKTALASLVVDRRTGRARARCTGEPPFSDEDIEEVASEPRGWDKIAIDAPFGWPVPFVSAVNAHDQRQPWLGPMDVKFRLRATDLFVKAKTGITPLPVSASFIGTTAMRCAYLQPRIVGPRTNYRVDRTG